MFVLLFAYAKTSTVRLISQKQNNTITLIQKSEILNHDPPSVQTGLCITRPEMWDYFFFFKTSKKSLRVNDKDSRDKTNKKAY